MNQPVLVRDLAFPAIERQFLRVLKERPGVELGEDAETVHDFRVALRRLRAALEVFSPALNVPGAAGARAIVRLGHRFRGLRDHDVLLETLGDLPAAAGVAERVELQRIVGILRQRREQALAEARAAFRGRGFTGLRRRLSSWVESPVWRWAAGLAAGEVLPDLLAPVLRRFWLHPGWGIGARVVAGRLQVERGEKGGGLTESLDAAGESLHQLRRIGKRVRYQLEPLLDIAGPGSARRLDQLRRLQSVLGRLQDAQVLARTLDQLCDGSARNRLPALWQRLDTERDGAWADWQPLHRHFIRPDARQAWRLLGRN